MSTETAEELDHQITEQLAEMVKAGEAVRKMVPWLWGLLVGAFSIGIWVATIEWRQHRQEAEVDKQAAKTNEIDDKLSDLAIWQASTDSSRFTISEAHKLLETINTTHNGLDKRVQRNEDTLVNIWKTLDRIEGNLDKIVEGKAQASSK